MLHFFADILQDPTQAVPGTDGFNWTDYGPLGVMAAGLVTAVVILWRKLEREQADGKASAEKVLTVLIEVNRVLPEVLATMKERTNDPGPALARLDEQMETLQKAVKSLATKTKRAAR